MTDGILVLSDFVLNKTQTHRQIAKPKRLNARQNEAARQNEVRQNEAANDLQYLPIAEIGKTSVTNTIRGLCLENGRKFDFKDRKGKDSKVFNFKLKDTTGTIQISVFDEISGFDNFFNLVQVRTILTF